MITFNSSGPSIDEPAQSADRMQARLQRKCFACDDLIRPGHWIVPVSRDGKRRRWKHEDCDNVPAVQSDGIDAAARERIDELQQELQRETKRLRNQIDILKAAAPRKIIVERKDAPAVQIDGVVHPIFDDVLTLASARQNVFLPGPTGCGKTHLAKQVADALGLPFGFVSCSIGMSEGQLTGRLLPVGDNGSFTYVISKFVECYENGGVFLLDELDAADSNVLLVVNAALANGHMPVPNRPENPIATRHADFVCIAAANTWGTGADRSYVGRNQLDAATLDRFRIGTCPMDYDPTVEKTLVTDGELYRRLVKYRENIRAARLERAMSTRFLLDANKMVTEWGWSYERVDQAFFSGWRDDEVCKVKGSAI